MYVFQITIFNDRIMLYDRTMWFLHCGLCELKWYYVSRDPGFHRNRA